MASFGRDLLTAVCAVPPEHTPSLLHVTEIAARAATSTDWPTWVHPEVLAALLDRGIAAPWSHQVQAAELAHAGHDVAINTGTASGKSLAFQLPILDSLTRDPRARTLYLSPTKALGHDQLRTAHTLTAAAPSLRDVAPAAYDGDATPEEIGRAHV